MEHHRLDLSPIPEDKSALYINEPWFVDKSLKESLNRTMEPDEAEDNIRVYVPMDINRNAILRRPIVV